MQGGTAYDALVRKDRGFSFCDTRMMDGGVRNRSGTALMRLPDRKVGEAFLDANEKRGMLERRQILRLSSHCSAFT